MKDTHLLGNDVLCLTETQLQIDDTPYNELKLQQHFKIHFNSKKKLILLFKFCFAFDL